MSMSITSKFCEKDRNRTETDQVSIYFGSNRNKKSCQCPCRFPCPNPCRFYIYVHVYVMSVSTSMSTSMSTSKPMSNARKCINLPFRFVSKRRFFVSVRSETVSNQNKPKRKLNSLSCKFRKDRNRIETDRVLACFGSNRNKNCLFRGHPNMEAAQRRAAQRHRCRVLLPTE
jgi:hypothetical protein